MYSNNFSTKHKLTNENLLIYGISDTAVDILHLSKAVAKTPYKMWAGKNPNIRHLHAYGCPAKAQPHMPYEKKLDCKTISCYFVGYSKKSRGFNFMILQLNPFLK